MSKSTDHLLKLLVPYTPPSWASHLSSIPKYKIQLANLPTPIKEWKLDFCKDRQLYIKQDDLTGFLESGNKIRKLEFLLADAVLKGCDCVITIGGIQSNHCRATAVAARSLGLESYLILRQSEDLDKPIGFSGNLLINRFMNANIRLVSLENYKKYGYEKLLKMLEAELIKEGKKPYIVPLGGSNEIGAWGYIEAIREIKQQMETQQLKFDDIVFACGSGGTATGLALGAALSNLNVKVHGISVCDNAQYFHNHVNDTLKMLNANLKSEDILDIIDDYKGIGYAKSTKQELELLRNVAFSSGVILDPVYSGKAANGLLNDKRFKGRKVLFVHTGGVFGLYAHVPELEKLSIISADKVKKLNLPGN